MKKNICISLFAIAVLTDLLGIYFNNREVQLISKPVIVPSLILYFLLQTYSSGSSLSRWILLALFFSWVGDVLLMFDHLDPLYFLLGLSFFLLAHLCYILFFHRIRIIEKIKSNLWLLLVVVVYYAVLIYVLSPYLEEFKIAVRVYGIVISFMLMLALHMMFTSNKKAGRQFIAGALLFVMSDSVLAINKFYFPFEAAGLIIMLTYALAQFFLVNGAIEYIKKFKV